MPKILITDGIHPAGLARLQEVADVDQGKGNDGLVERIGGYDALIVRSETRVDRDVLEAGTNLQVVGRAGVGVDNIDVAAATALGVPVVNAPTGNIVAASELTVALIFALARNVSQAHAALREGSWERRAYTGLEVRNKTLGLIGLGRVATEVARRVQGLDMRVVAYDPFVGPERAHRLGVEVVSSIERLLSESDFVSIHTSLTNQTRGLIGEKELQQMKPTAFLINVARGGIADEAALLKGLDQGWIAGAGLDVFSEEPPTSGPAKELLRHPKVVATPHLGASTVEGQENVGLEIAEEVIAVLHGRPAQHVVNLPPAPPETYMALAPYTAAMQYAAKIASQLVRGQLHSVSFKYEGEISQYDPTLLKAAGLAGILDVTSDERVTPVNAMLLAEQRGLQVTEQCVEESSSHHESLVVVSLHTSQGEISIAATSTKGDVHIVRYKSFWLDITPSTPSLMVIEHHDQPGIVGALGTITAKYDLNIAFMDVGRKERRGDAVMMVGIDEPIPDQALAEIRSLPQMRTADVVQL